LAREKIDISKKSFDEESILEKAGSEREVEEISKRKAFRSA
jgi:hypothetical protein